MSKRRSCPFLSLLLTALMLVLPQEAAAHASGANTAEAATAPRVGHGNEDTVVFGGFPHRAEGKAVMTATSDALTLRVPNVVDQNPDGFCTDFGEGVSGIYRQFQPLDLTTAPSLSWSLDIGHADLLRPPEKHGGSLVRDGGSGWLLKTSPADAQAQIYADGHLYRLPNNDVAARISDNGDGVNLITWGGDVATVKGEWRSHFVLQFAAPVQVYLGDEDGNVVVADRVVIVRRVRKSARITADCMHAQASKPIVIDALRFSTPATLGTAQAWDGACVAGLFYPCGLPFHQAVGPARILDEYVPASIMEGYTALGLRNNGSSGTPAGLSVGVTRASGVNPSVVSVMLEGVVLSPQSKRRSRDEEAFRVETFGGGSVRVLFPAGDGWELCAAGPAFQTGDPYTVEIELEGESPMTQRIEAGKCAQGLFPSRSIHNEDGFLIDTVTAGVASPKGPFTMTLIGSADGEGAFDITVSGPVPRRFPTQVVDMTITTTAPEWALIFDVAKLLGLK